MTRTTRGTTAVTALLALAALQGRAVADAPAAGPAVWQPAGKVLAGAPTTADAPPMTPAVTYRDTIKPGETKYYGIALDGTSSAYASAFAVPQPGTRVAYGDGIELTLQSSSGQDCDSADAHFEAEDDARPVGTAVSRPAGADLPCQGANQYTLQVTRTSAGTSDPGAWPLELRYVAEPALKPGARPGPAPQTGTSGTSGTASPTPLITGTPHQARGGVSFDTAAAVRTGIWKDKVLPGETRFYWVPVDWGQRATVFADFSNAQATSDSAYTSSGVMLSAYSPVRRLIDTESTAYQGQAASVSEQLAPVAYANRTVGDSQVSAVRYAGRYYFAVTVHPDVAQGVEGPVPVTLRIDVTGAAQAAPAYAGNPAAAGIGIDAHDVSSANGTRADGGDTSAAGGTSGMRFLAFAALGAGTVLLLSLAGWAATARRRAARTVDAVPPQAGYGPPSGW